MGFERVRQLDHRSIRDYVFCQYEFPLMGVRGTYSIPISAAWRITAGSAPRHAAIPAAWIQSTPSSQLLDGDHGVLTAIEHATPTSLYISAHASRIGRWRKLTIHPPSAALIVAPRLKSIPIAICQYSQIAQKSESRTYQRQWVGTSWYCRGVSHLPWFSPTASLTLVRDLARWTRWHILMLLESLRLRHWSYPSVSLPCLLPLFEWLTEQ
jgi:hypothetical protein